METLSTYLARRGAKLGLDNQGLYLRGSMGDGFGILYVTTNGIKEPDDVQSITLALDLKGSVEAHITCAIDTLGDYLLLYKGVTGDFILGSIPTDEARKRFHCVCTPALIDSLIANTIVALLPCPFCGESAQVVKQSTTVDAYTVSCDHCKARITSCPSERAAIGMWNRRFEK